MKNQVRKARLTDVDALSGLFDQYRVFYEKPSDEKAAKAFLTERITREESEIFVVFHPSGTMAGFVQLYPLFSSTRMKRVWLLNDLFVASEFRGQGFSVQLIEKAKELCRNTNALGMMLETDKTNSIGNNLYPKTGFVLDTAHNFYTWEV